MSIYSSWWEATSGLASHPPNYNVQIYTLLTLCLYHKRPWPIKILQLLSQNIGKIVKKEDRWSKGQKSKKKIVGREKKVSYETPSLLPGK